MVKQLRVVDNHCRTGRRRVVVVLPEIKRSADAAGVAQKLIGEPLAAGADRERELTVTPSSASRVSRRGRRPRP